jgi:serine/threonine-protein kinase
MSDLTTSKLIPGATGARNPTFSPDGKWIVFWVGGHVKKVSVSGGEPDIVYTMDDPMQKTAQFWTKENSIIFVHEKHNDLFQIDAIGGTPVKINESDTVSFNLTYPQLLPDGQSILVDFKDKPQSEASLALFNITTGNYTNMIDHYGHAQYVQSGHIINGMNGELLAIPFSLDKTRITGPAVSVVSNVLTKNNGSSFYAISDNGTLIYPQGGRQNSEQYYLVKIDLSGKSEIIQLPVTEIHSPKISPDGLFCAFHSRQETQNIWIFDLEQKTSRRLTDDQSDNIIPLWTLDGKQIVYSSKKSNGPWNLIRMSVDGSEPPDTLLESDNWIGAQSFTPDGLYLIYQQYNKTNEDILVLPLQKSQKSYAYLQSPAGETASTLSPNGKWIAYCSNESGQPQVYVRKYPGPGGFRQVSSEGGIAPVWAPNGNTLYYRSLDSNTLYAIPFQTKPILNIGQPTALLEGSDWIGQRYSQNYDISPDGKYFLMIRGEKQDFWNFIVVYNWFEELREKMAAAGIENR